MRSGPRAMWTVVTASLLAACAGPPVMPAPRSHSATAPRAAIVTGTGALVDKENRWRGAVQGEALGSILDGRPTQISSRAARESVALNQPVAYQSTDGWQRIEAAPHESRSVAGCRHVRERIYQDNQLVREQIREVC
jgi:hypothetical protein